MGVHRTVLHRTEQLPSTGVGKTGRWRACSLSVWPAALLFLGVAWVGCQVGVRRGRLSIPPNPRRGGKPASTCNGISFFIAPVRLLRGWPCPTLCFPPVPANRILEPVVYLLFKPRFAIFNRHELGRYTVRRDILARLLERELLRVSPNRTL